LKNNLLKLLSTTSTLVQLSTLNSLLNLARSQITVTSHRLPFEIGIF